MLIMGTYPTLGVVKTVHISVDRQHKLADLGIFIWYDDNYRSHPINVTSS